MATEIEETSTPKVVNWDVAEERDFEELRVEMDEHKDKMMALESKAVLLRSKLDKKVELSEANTSSGVKVVALEYKTVKMRVGKMFNDRMVSIMPKPNWFGCLSPPPPNFHKVQSDTLDTIYKEFEEETMKKLGQEGWTLRAVHGRGAIIIHSC
jgi:hypothetical protein